MLNGSRHRPHLRGLLVFRTDVPKLAEDGSDLFNYLTGYSEQEEYHEFLIAPLGLRDGIVRLIDGQAERAAGGSPAASRPR
jgi:polyphosphate kinase